MLFTSSSASTKQKAANKLVRLYEKQDYIF